MSSNLVLNNMDEMRNNSTSYNALLVINYLCLFVGSVSSTLITKFYFIHKGSSRWISTWVQSAGFPLLIFPIFAPYYLFKCTTRKPFSEFTQNLWILCIFIGFLLGINNLLVSWGNSYLPVSTLSLLLSCQLLFILLFSVIIVKQKVTFLNAKCVLLLTASSVILALGSAEDKQKDITRTQYYIGFISAIGAGLMFSLYLPVMEKMYKPVNCYAMVMEIQLIMEIAATVLATIGLAFDEESSMEFDLGPGAYWLTVILSTFTWQLCMMGTAGLVFLTTSLTGGVCMTALMVINVLGGVVFYGDKFGARKGFSTFLSVWGFASYLVGIYLDTKKKMKKKNEEERCRLISEHESVPVLRDLAAGDGDGDGDGADAHDDDEETVVLSG